MAVPVLTIYTDGACKGNPGPGGWGALLCYGDRQQTLQGSALSTTNNRMELMAAIEALQHLQHPCSLVLVTDSQYLQKGISEWLPLWKQRDWRKADGKPVKNVDLWQSLEAAVARHEVSWQWVRGHSGHPGNATADHLARTAIP